VSATRPILELTVDSIAHGGVCVARHDGRVVFVSDAIPGERVRVQVTDDRYDRFWRAVVVEVVTASPDRREHVWREASCGLEPDNRVGGAELGHIALPRQRLLKAEVVHDAFVRFAGIEQDVTVAAVRADGGLVGASVNGTLITADEVSEEGTGWRTRVRLHVAGDGLVGPYAARSHRVIPVTSLPLAAPELSELAPLGSRLDGVREVRLTMTSCGRVSSVAVMRDESNRNKKNTSPVIVEQVGDRMFHLNRDGFWQVHRGAAVTLTTVVQEMIDGQLVDPSAPNLDLYGGVGLFAAAMGDQIGGSLKITSVESDAQATEYAANNLAEWAGAHAVTARVDHYLADLASGMSRRAPLSSATIILDPPRAGAGRSVIDHLAVLGARQIIYVACDPIALARDAGLLGAHGYRLDALRALDLFPHTYHVEVVARFVRTD